MRINQGPQSSSCLGSTTSHNYIDCCVRNGIKPGLGYAWVYCHINNAVFSLSSRIASIHNEMPFNGYCIVVMLSVTFNDGAHIEYSNEYHKQM